LRITSRVTGVTTHADNDEVILEEGETKAPQSYRAAGEG
jgi:hypothetical protein